MCVWHVIVMQNKTAEAWCCLDEGHVQSNHFFVLSCLFDFNCCPQHSLSDCTQVLLSPCLNTVPNCVFFSDTSVCIYYHVHVLLLLFWRFAYSKINFGCHGDLCPCSYRSTDVTSEWKCKTRCITSTVKVCYCICITTICSPNRKQTYTQLRKTDPGAIKGYLNLLLHVFIFTTHFLWIATSDRDSFLSTAPWTVSPVSGEA